MIFLSCCIEEMNWCAIGGNIADESVMSYIGSVIFMVNSHFLTLFHRSL